MTEGTLFCNSIELNKSIYKNLITLILIFLLCRQHAFEIICAQKASCNSINSLYMDLFPLSWSTFCWNIFIAVIRTMRRYFPEEQPIFSTLYSLSVLFTYNAFLYDCGDFFIAHWKSVIKQKWNYNCYFATLIWTGIYTYRKIVSWGCSQGLVMKTIFFLFALPNRYDPMTG